MANFMLSTKKQEGALGEKIASDFLKKKNYKILEYNFRLRNGEIDIIAIDNSEKEKVLVFIEVKTRKSHQFGTPLEAIGYYKLKALTNAAQVYKMSHRGLPEALRIDAIAIILDEFNEVSSIEHIKNISP
jgi:putative endonuclease